MCTMLFEKKIFKSLSLNRIKYFFYTSLKQLRHKTTHFWIIVFIDNITTTQKAAQM